MLSLRPTFDGHNSLSSRIKRTNHCILCMGIDNADTSWLGNCVRAMTDICGDPWHDKSSISSQIYRACPSCRHRKRAARKVASEELERTKIALDIARQWIEDPGVQKQIDLALEGKF